MQLKDYPQCCGIKILHGFGDDEECYTTLGDCEEYLQIQEKAYIGNVAILMVALNTVEQNKLGEVFEKRNWTKATDGWSNPRTGHKITLWLWKCVGAQPKKKKALIQPTGQGISLKKRVIGGRSSLRRRSLTRYDW